MKSIYSLIIAVNMMTALVVTCWGVKAVGGCRRWSGVERMLMVRAGGWDNGGGSLRGSS